MSMALAVCQSLLLLFVYVILLILAVFLRFAQVRGLADQRWLRNSYARQECSRLGRNELNVKDKP